MDQFTMTNMVDNVLPQNGKQMIVTKLMWLRYVPILITRRSDEIVY